MKNAMKGMECLGIVSVMSRHIDIVVVTDARCMHQAGHLPFVFVQFFVIIVHGGFFLMLMWFLVEVVTEPSYAVSTKDAEYISLLLREFWWCFSTERCEHWVEERLHASKTEMGKTGTVID